MGRRRDAGRRRRVHPGLLRRPGPALHASGVLRPTHRLAVAPPRDPRQPPRARHVGGRGTDPPVPHQGARRAAADLPAVLRPLHPDGPRRQLHAAGRQAQARRQAGRPVCRDARLPVQRRRRSATSSCPVATWPTCRGRTSRRSSTGCWRSTTSATSGWPPRRSWACRSTGCSPTSSRAWAGSPTKARARGVSLAIHTHVNNGAVGDARGGGGGQGDARRRGARRAQPGRPHARRQRLDRAAARPVLRALRRRLDHAVLLLHVRHDPVRRALAALARRGPAPPARDHGLPARVRHAAHRLRRPVRRQALGAPGRGATTPSAGSPTGARTTAPRSRATTPRRCRATTSTTTRSTPCPRRVSSGGASRATTRRPTRSPSSGPRPAARRRSSDAAARRWRRSQQGSVAARRPGVTWST